MPAYFEQGFMVREAAWHRMGTVLAEYPGREEAKRLAGHNYRIVETPLFERHGSPEDPRYVEAPDFKRLVCVADVGQEDECAVHGNKLKVVGKEFPNIPNDLMYEFAEALLGEGLQYETGITMKGGAAVALTVVLPEPVTITGDDSITLQYLGLSLHHDGTGAFKGRSTSVRHVCWNTTSASEAEGARLGTDFTIRHTKNWQDRVSDARNAIKGVRNDLKVYRAAMEEFAAMPVRSPSLRELFATAVVLDQTTASVSRFKADVARGHYTPRVQRNVEEARDGVLALFNGPTIPEAHRHTAYGLHLAGVEHFDHLRSYRSDDTYVGRTLLNHEPAKARLPRLVREIAAMA